MQGTCTSSQVQEDPTCLRATNEDPAQPQHENKVHFLKKKHSPPHTSSDNQKGQPSGFILLSFSTSYLLTIPCSVPFVRILQHTDLLLWKQSTCRARRPLNASHQGCTGPLQLWSPPASESFVLCGSIRHRPLTRPSYSDFLFFDCTTWRVGHYFP